MVKARATRNVFSAFGVMVYMMQTYIMDVWVINYNNAITTINTDTLKLMNRKIQEDYFNPEINSHYNSKSGVHPLAALDRMALAVTWLFNKGMDRKMDLLNKIN